MWLQSNCLIQDGSGGKSFIDENMKHVPDDLEASLKSAADDLAGEFLLPTTVYGYQEEDEGACLEISLDSG